MKKLLLATAVSAAFAAPATVLAQQSRVPTLGQVLDASGLSVNGYIDAGYNWANRNVEAGIQGTPAAPGVPPRVFDNQNNSFSLHQLGLTVAKQPKEGFGGLVNFTVGSDAQLARNASQSRSSSAPRNRSAAARIPASSPGGVDCAAVTGACASATTTENTKHVACHQCACSRDVERIVSP